MADYSDATIVQFGFTSGASTSLNLGGSLRSASVQPSALKSLKGSSVTFCTVRSVTAARQLVPTRTLRRIAPFASISMASITAAPAKAKVVAKATDGAVVVKKVHLLLMAVDAAPRIDKLHLHMLRTLPYLLSSPHLCAGSQEPHG